MPIQVTGATGVDGQNGHDESLETFVIDHLNTSRQLQNFAAGRKLTLPLPPYDPSHPDNHWPVMIYHAVNAPETIGVTLLGLKDDPVTKENKRTKTAMANEAALKHALGRPGWRLEPFVKPNVRILSPEEEKANLIASIADRDAKINALADSVQRLVAENAQRDKASAPEAPQKAGKG